MTTQQIPSWELWEHRALQFGVPPSLAALGRRVMAEWHQQGKDDSSLGDEADGDFMIDLCLGEPDEAERRFREALGLGPEA
ncbi:MAG: hypothetical protein H6R10_1977 [Rhodocyclaceae bacterium]|nr:hypothetical protein [Rhodocyclaceae bacterium]